MSSEAERRVLGPLPPPCGSRVLHRHWGCHFRLDAEGFQMPALWWLKPRFSAPTCPGQGSSRGGAVGLPLSLKMGGFGARDRFTTKMCDSIPAMRFWVVARLAWLSSAEGCVAHHGTVPPRRVAVLCTAGMRGAHPRMRVMAHGCTPPPQHARRN